MSLLLSRRLNKLLNLKTVVFFLTFNVFLGTRIFYLSEKSIDADKLLSRVSNSVINYLCG